MDNSTYVTYYKDENGKWWAKCKTQRWAAEDRYCILCNTLYKCRPFDKRKFCSSSCRMKANYKNGCLPKIKAGNKHHLWRGGRFKGHDGYVFVYQPGHPAVTRNYIKEHRYIMEQYLGRYLNENENVHHKNGIRDDNRLENLELWVKTQPCGQRATDLLAFAKEIIKTYGSEEDKLNLIK